MGSPIHLQTTCLVALKLSLLHAERTADGLSRALAWAAGRWSERFALAALLADPDATTLLR